MSETPSISVTKWSSIDDELAGRQGMEPGAKYIGDRKSSEVMLLISRELWKRRGSMSQSCLQVQALEQTIEGGGCQRLLRGVPPLFLSHHEQKI